MLLYVTGEAVEVPGPGRPAELAPAGVGGPGRRHRRIHIFSAALNNSDLKKCQNHRTQLNMY